MSKTIEAVIEPDGKVRLLEKIDFKETKKAIVTILDENFYDDALLSEMSLSEGWLRSEEDEAWGYLQKERTQNV